MLGDMKGGTETGRACADDDNIVIAGGHGKLLGVFLFNQL
jgi:hypothetical protein